MTEVAQDTSLDILEIMKRLPHRYPFLMIDKVVELIPGKRGVGYKNVSVNEPHFQGHFPGNPVMPGVLIVEALAQLGGIVTSAVDGPTEKPRMGFLAAINKTKFRRQVKPGDCLRLEVEVVTMRTTLGKVKAVASVDGATAAEAEILFVMDPPENG